MVSERYDVVLYGATGFTGTHVLKNLINNADVNFAVAGRSKERLYKIIQELATELDEDLSRIGVIVANSFDQESLAEMAKRAKVIINVVGPFRLYGEAVVKAAVENGANYVDICGEPTFLESMQMKYDELARKNSVCIVGACGWDSIPCDLGFNLLKQKFVGQLNNVETFVQMKSGPAGYSINAGTYRSLILGLANIQKDGLGKIRRSIMPERLPKSSFKSEQRGTLWQNERIDSWCLPFYGSDKSVVMRSQYFDYTLHNKLPAQVETYLCVKSYFWALLLALWLTIFSTLAKFKFARDFLLSHPDLCSFGMFTEKGPSKQQIKEASFSYWFFGIGWDEEHETFGAFKDKPTKKIAMRCDGPDAGYVATAGCVVAAALSMLNDADKLPQGGVYTPAAAFKNTGIYERLKQNNINFVTVETL